MVENAVNAHGFLQMIEGLGRHAFEQWVGLSRHFHAIDNVVARQESIDHFGNTFAIVVLQVGIERDNGIGPVLSRHHSGHDGILMAGVVGKVDAPNERIVAV